MTERADAIDVYLHDLDPEALARIVRDEVAQQTGTLAQLVAGRPCCAGHPTLQGQRLEAAMETVANYATLVSAATLLRVLHGAELAAAVR